ncbi:molybdopterin converting factor subunit 1 [Oceanobacillus sp. FSL H7-0719]|uniref:molybdopterin converting factor subunit 1 n=1 Tax=Oceanobacillus sp. FSL H7-0719 TaxID=2954507 RepID=UPI00324810B3
MVKVLLFAELQDRIGHNELEIPIGETNVQQLKQKLEQEYPALSLEKVMTAINEEYANDSDAIAAGDTVAFIPPVSGG